MSIQLGVWKVTDSNKPEKVPSGGIDKEKKLENILAEDITIAQQDWLVIGRQVYTDNNKYIDLLAIDSEGRLVVLELKKSRTYRDTVAQVLDYGAFVGTLEDKGIAKIYQDYKDKCGLSDQSIDEAYRNKFKIDLPDELNASHVLVIVASTLDSETERIVNYLRDYGNVDINVLFFDFFQNHKDEFLARAWLVDSQEKLAVTKASHSKSSWNGEYYASFMEDKSRKWEDARKYGFVSAGGGEWYSKTLSMLEPEDRIWVNHPGLGYIGVARVLEGSVPVDQFLVNGQPIQEVVPSTKNMLTYAKHGTDAEYLVKVEWIKTVPLNQAFKELGFFGNQNTVARPRSDKWPFTVERLKKRFGIKE